MSLSERVPARSHQLAASPLRIVLLTRALGFGGAERQIVHLANGLARRGHLVSVATLYSGSTLEAELEGPNPALLALDKRNRWDIAGFAWRLVQRIRALKPDVIYAFLPVPNLLATVVRLVACRRAALVWGLRGTPLELSEYDWLSRVTIWVEQQTASAPDLIIANSTAGAEWAGTADLPAGRLVVVPNGIDTAAIQPATQTERDSARRTLGLRPDATVVAVVARLDPMKDHASFLQAFAGASAADPALQAVIAGAGTPAFTAGLQARATALGITDRIVWAPPRRDVTTLYHAADFLCLPSAFGEGFPNVLGEAMAAGLRCIATAVGDSAAVLGPCGKVVPPRDIGALQQAILDVARDARQGSWHDPSARQRVVERFSIDRMIGSTEALLEQVVACPGRRA